MTQTPIPDPRTGSFIARFFRGAAYLLRAYRFVISEHRQLLKYCLLPFGLALLVALCTIVGFAIYGGDIIDYVWPKPDGTGWQVLWALLYVFFVLLVLLIAYVVFFIGQALLTAPFNDALSEQVEALAFGREPPPFSVGRVGRGAWMSVAHEAGKLVVYLVVMGALLVFKLVVPVVGTAVFLVGGFVLTSVFFAYDFMDLALARREWAFGRKWSLIRGNRALTLGFGAGIAALLLVPLVGTFSIPMAAVGGTLLVCDLEQVGAFEDRPTDLG